MKTITTALTIILLATSALAQTDSLFLYTKKTCSNCIQTKKQLQNNKISYKEFTLEDTKNAKEMLAKLSALGYHDRISLPVIFLNSTLYYPAQLSDSGFVHIYLGDVVDHIVAQQKKGTISLGVTDHAHQADTTNHEESDCDIDLTPIYIMCLNTKTESEAIDYVKTLKAEGYPDAGMISYKKFYRVYYSVQYDQQTAQQVLQKNRTKFEMSYTLILK